MLIYPVHIYSTPMKTPWSPQHGFPCCRVRDLQDVKFVQRAGSGASGGSQKRAGVEGKDRCDWCTPVGKGSQSQHDSPCGQIVSPADDM